MGKKYVTVHSRPIWALFSCPTPRHSLAHRRTVGRTIPPFPGASASIPSRSFPRFSLLTQAGCTAPSPPPLVAVPCLAPLSFSTGQAPCPSSAVQPPAPALPMCPPTDTGYGSSASNSTGPPRLSLVVSHCPMHHHLHNPTSRTSPSSATVASRLCRPLPASNTSAAPTYVVGPAATARFTNHHRWIATFCHAAQIRNPAIVATSLEDPDLRKYPSTPSFKPPRVNCSEPPHMWPG